jgi:hypothetical protein
VFANVSGTLDMILVDRRLVFLKRWYPSHERFGVENQTRSIDVQWKGNLLDMSHCFCSGGVKALSLKFIPEGSDTATGLVSHALSPIKTPNSHSNCHNVKQIVSRLQALSQSWLWILVSQQKLNTLESQISRFLPWAGWWKQFQFCRRIDSIPESALNSFVTKENDSGNPFNVTTRH